MANACRFDHFGNQGLQAGKIKICLDAANGLSDVGGQQIELPFRHGSESPNGEIAREYDDRHADATVQVIQVAVQTVQFLVAALHLLVDGDQLFVSGFQLFFRRLQLFVDALQLFVGRLHLLVGSLEFLVTCFVFLQYRLQVIARLGQLALQLSNLTGLIVCSARRHLAHASTRAFRDGARFMFEGLALVHR